LIGAGWGGCIVSLAVEDKVESFIGQLKENYPPYRKLTEEELAEFVFATKPSTASSRLWYAQSFPSCLKYTRNRHYARTANQILKEWFAYNDDNVLTLEWVTKEYNSNPVERAISLARRTRETQREENRTLSAASFIHEALKDTNQEWGDATLHRKHMGSSFITFKIGLNRYRPRRRTALTFIKKLFNNNRRIKVTRNEAHRSSTLHVRNEDTFSPGIDR
ncbi:hypothetical protein M378DRAFT_12856, partial [Amanita muscaria Koide BX008]